MRITGGKARGIHLQSPNRGQTRPATDYLREAVFASLGNAVEGARVLDCFAGTGAYALEAMSRGAHSATLVEQNAAAVRCIRQNVAAVAKSARFDAGLVDIRQGDAVQAIRRLSAAPLQYTLVFVDPPYELWQGRPAALLAALAALLRTGAPEGEEAAQVAALHDTAAKGAPLPQTGAQSAAGAGVRLVLEAPGLWTPPLLEGLRLLRHLKKGAHQPAALIYAPDVLDTRGVPAASGMAAEPNKGEVPEADSTRQLKDH